MADTKKKGGRKAKRGWQDGFLDAFKQTGMVTEACKVARICRTTAYKERQRDETFALKWADIEEETTERMEREAFRRGTEGVYKPVYQGGKQVGAIREYSDTLLIFMLKSRRPEKYRDHHVIEHSGEVTKRVKLDLAKLTDDQLEALEGIAQSLEG